MTSSNGLGASRMEMVLAGERSIRLRSPRLDSVRSPTCAWTCSRNRIWLHSAALMGTVASDWAGITTLLSRGWSVVQVTYI